MILQIKRRVQNALGNLTAEYLLLLYRLKVTLFTDFSSDLAVLSSFLLVLYYFLFIFFASFCGMKQAFVFMLFVHALWFLH